jgi:hypothetical protein
LSVPIPRKAKQEKSCSGQNLQVIVLSGHSAFARGSGLGGACLMERRERKELRNKTMFLTPPSLSCSMVLRDKCS